MITETAPAQAIEAERAILAAMLANPLHVREAKYLLSPADFYRPAHQLIFTAICELEDSGVRADPVVLMNHLNKPVPGQASQTWLGRVGGAPYLHTVYSSIFTAGNVEYYAEQIRGAGRMRSIAAASVRLGQIGELTDVEAALDLAAAVSIELQLAVDAPVADVVKGHYRLADFLAIADSAEDWIVPDLLAVQDAMMWLGDEGLGKSWLLRQIAVCVAFGVHPLRPERAIDPRRALLLDVENAEVTLRRGLRTMAVAVGRWGEYLPGNLELLARPGGMNLRRRDDRLVIERLISNFRPDVVVAGPMYKLAPRGRDDWDTAASEAREVLDGWRERYDVAYVLEHHMPKGDGLNRPLTPFGGSEWMRWVTHGRVIREIPDSRLYELHEFRGDREWRDLPQGFSRSGDLPWNPVWDQDEINWAKGMDPDGKKIK